MKIALVGPPLSGKTSLFQAVTGSEPDPARYHGAKPQPGMVTVPDERLDQLAAYHNPKKLTHAQLEILDFAGIEPGARTENIKQVFAAMREADALLVVLSAFDGESSEAIGAQWTSMQSEILFADLEVMEKRIEKLAANVNKPTKTQEQDKKELAVLRKIRAHVEEHETWQGLDLDDVEEKAVRGFRFLMQKPLVPVINADEPGRVDPAEALPAEAAARALVLNAEVEREVSQLPPEERRDFLAEFGIAEPAGPRVIRAAYEALGLISFFTVGEDECRAWTVEKGANAVTAAGKIHSDLARGFIRAETYHYDDFAELDDEKTIKAKGRLRLEGKEYTVKDGDIMNIRFSV